MKTLIIDRTKVMEFFRHFNASYSLAQNLSLSDLYADEVWYATKLLGAHLNQFVNGFVGISLDFDTQCTDLDFRKSVVNHLVTEITLLGTARNSWYELVPFDGTREFKFV